MVLTCTCIYYQDLLYIPARVYLTVVFASGFLVLLISLYLLVPAGPPLNFTFASTDPTVLILSWSLPKESLRNGVITGYEYMCADVHSGPQPTPELTATILGLTPFTSYNCSVKAATVNGTGPAISIIATTAEDSM